MSLINEALKRSESDKLRNSSPYFNNLTVMMPEGDEIPPPPRPTFERPRPPRRPTSRLLIAALAATACFGAWYFWGRSTGQVGPASASGESAQEQEVERPLTPAQMKAAAERYAPDASLDRHNTDSQARENAAAKSGVTGGIAANNVEDAFNAAMRKLQQTRQHEQPEESTGQADEEAPSATAAPEPGRTPSATPRAAPAVPAAPPPAAAPPATAPAKPAPQPSDDQDPSKLRVTAIMRGPDGNVALINGGLYREGQTIHGALIVKIGQYEVELTANGKQFTIRI
jgi:hypothetical protein